MYQHLHVVCMTRRRLTCVRGSRRFELAYSPCHAHQTSELRASWPELAHDSPPSPLSPPSSPRSPQQKVTAFAEAPEVSREAIRAKVHGARKGDGGAAAAADFVVGLLQPCEAVRLGCQSFGSLLEHAWCDGFEVVK